MTIKNKIYPHDSTNFTMLIKTTWAFSLMLVFYVGNIIKSKFTSKFKRANFQFRGITSVWKHYYYSQRKYSIKRRNSKKHKNFWDSFESKGTINTWIATINVHYSAIIWKLYRLAVKLKFFDVFKDWRSLIGHSGLIRKNYGTWAISSGFRIK